MSGTSTFRSAVWITAATLLVLTLGGCTVTKDLTYDSRLALQNDYFSPKEATDKLVGHVATVYAWSDSSKFNLVEVEAENVLVRRDSTLWMDVVDGRVRAVPTDHVAMISYRRDHAATEGFAFGITAAAPLGMGASYLTWRSIDRNGGFDNGTASIGAGVGILVVGLITFGASVLLGTIIGSTRDGGETIIVVNGFTPPDECVPSLDFPCGYRR